MKKYTYNNLIYVSLDFKEFEGQVDNVLKTAIRAPKLNNQDIIGYAHRKYILLHTAIPNSVTCT